MRHSELITEANKALKAKNVRKLEFLFTSHLKHSSSIELWALYLAYVSGHAESKATLRDAVVFAYQSTLLHLDSADTKLRYLEIIMETEEPAAVRDVYKGLLEIPLLGVEAIVELYRSYEAGKSRASYRKGASELQPKEAAAIAESRELQGVCGARGAESAIASDPVRISEFLTRKYKRLHPMYTLQFLLYTMDLVLEIAPGCTKAHFYKFVLLYESGAQMSSAGITNPATSAIMGAKTKAEFDRKLAECLDAALQQTENSVALLALRTIFDFSAEEFLGRLSGDEITAHSESFHIVFFSAVFRREGIGGLRKHLVRLAKEKRLGYRSYAFCAFIEGVIGREAKIAGGILLSGLKAFLALEEDGSPSEKGPEQRAKQREGRDGALGNKANALGITLLGTEILLSLGDFQKAKLLNDTYARGHCDNARLPAFPNEREADPRLKLLKYEILYESGPAAVCRLLGSCEFPAIFDLLLRAYTDGTGDSKQPGRGADAVAKFAAELGKIRDGQNIFRGVDIGELIRIIACMDI